MARNLSVPIFLLLLASINFTSAKITKLQFGRQSVDSETETETYDENTNKEPGQVSLGSFESYAHGLSGEVVIVDDKTIEINGLNYDGQGPAAWFMLGKESRSTLTEFMDLDGTVIPDENQSCDTLGRYSDADIKLKLPSNMKVTDFTYLSMYCLRFNHNFGYVTIPSDMKLKNGTSTGIEKCPEEDLAAAEEDSSSETGNRRPAQGPPQRPPEPQSGVSSLIDRVVDFLG